MQTAISTRPETAPRPLPAHAPIPREQLGNFLDAFARLEWLADSEPPRWLDLDQETDWWKLAEEFGDEARTLLRLARRSAGEALDAMSDALENEVMEYLGLDFWNGIACVPHPVLGWNFTYEQGRAFKRARYDAFWAAAGAASTLTLDELNALYDAK